MKDFMIQGGGFDGEMKQKATKAPVQNEANKAKPISAAALPWQNF